jgi:hypothetical protein
MLSWSPRSAIARGYQGVRLDKSAILVRELAGQVGATAVVVNDSDSELLSVGEPSATMHCRSIRKPLIGDLARFGQLYLRGGQHGGSTIIPPEWVIASTRAHTKTDNGPSYGYLWWIAHNGQLFAGTAVPDGSFAAYGTGSQFLLVIPALDRVIALLADPRRSGGTDRAAHRPKLAELVHYATQGAVTLTPDRDPANPTGTTPASGPY